MQHYEYKVVPAPARGEKERGVKTGVERFAHTLSALMNEMAAQGWDYLRAETLPAEERQGLTGKATVYHNLLVFRREAAFNPAQGLGKHAAAAPGADPAGHEPAANADAQPEEAAPVTFKRALSAEAPEGPAPMVLRARRDED